MRADKFWPFSSCRYRQLGMSVWNFPVLDTSRVIRRTDAVVADESWFGLPHGFVRGLVELDFPFQAVLFVTHPHQLRCPVLAVALQGKRRGLVSTLQTAQHLKVHVIAAFGN